MLLIFPWLAWLAAIASATLLALLWWADELSGRAAAVLLVWFLLAAACQFLGTSEGIQAVGLALQTVLAVGLIIRGKAGS